MHRYSICRSRKVACVKWIRLRRRLDGRYEYLLQQEKTVFPWQRVQTERYVTYVTQQAHIYSSQVTLLGDLELINQKRQTNYFLNGRASSWCPVANFAPRGSLCPADLVLSGVQDLEPGDWDQVLLEGRVKSPGQEDGIPLQSGATSGQDVHFGGQLEKGSCDCIIVYQGLNCSFPYINDPVQNCLYDNYNKIMSKWR